jgi:hypothetical protein
MTIYCICLLPLQYVGLGCSIPSCYLVGVIPGRGVTPDPTAKRLTFMVGFWRGIKAKYRGADQAGPAQPFPNTTLHVVDNVLTTIPYEESKLKWHREMKMKDFTGTEKKTSFNILHEVNVSPIWETIDVVDDVKSTSHKIATQPGYNSCFQGF